MAADFEQVIVSIRLFFTWVLCIYIILEKGCHILYVFLLNSTVCSHIIDLPLSSDQVTYDFIMDVDEFLMDFPTASAYQKFLSTFSVY